MENLIKKYNLIGRKGPTMDMISRRRDFVAELLNDDGSFKKGVSMADAQIIVMQKMEAEGYKLGVKEIRGIQLDVTSLRHILHWTASLESRKPDEFPRQFRWMLPRLMQQFPVDGQAPAPISPPDLPGPTSQSPQPILLDVGRLAPSDLERIREVVRQEIERATRSPTVTVGGEVRRVLVHIPPEPQKEISPEEKLKYDFPSLSVPTKYEIVYTHGFLSSYKKAPGGLLHQIKVALSKLANHGEDYPGLNFKKGETGRLEKYLMPLASLHHFRVNRRWRILVNVSRKEQRYYIMKLAHHDELDKKGTR